MKTPGLLLLTGLVILPLYTLSQHLLNPEGNQSRLNQKATHDFQIGVYSNSADTCENPVEFDLYILPASCPGQCDGTIEVDVTNGSPPYTYWLEADSCVGLFTLFVMDAAGCIDSAAGFMYFESDIEILDLSITFATDNQFNGSVVVEADNGVPPYLYSIDGINYQLSSVFTDLAPGAYCITIQDANGCSIKSDTFWIENTTGISTIHHDIQFYPNPVQSTLYLNSAEPITLDLFTMDGKQLRSLPRSASHAMDVADLPRGLYAVRMQGDMGISVQKILLE